MVSLFSGKYDASTTVRVWCNGIVPPISDINIPPDIDDNHVKYDEATGINYIDNSIMLFFKHGTAEVKKTEIINSVNGKITWKISETEYTIEIPVSKLQEIDQICNKLMTRDEVVYAVGDMVFEDLTQRIPNDTWNNDSWNEADPREENWGLEAIEAPSAWDYNDRFQHIGVGVIDDGFDIGHEDLKNRFQLVPDWANSINSKEAHGTHVSGVIGAEANNNKGITGIVWNSTIYGVPYLKAWETSYEAAFARVIAGLRYCVEAGAKVVNFSLGMTGTFEDTVFSLSEEAMRKHSRTTSVIMQQLLQEGYDFIAVQASGNGTDGHTDPNQRLAVDAVNNGWFASVTEDNIILIDDQITKQEILDRIIIVGNAQRNSDGNFQQHVTSNGGSRVDICAPGTEIYSTVPGGLFGKYESEGWTGTSMAAPHVTGVAALVWSINPDFTGPEVKDIVCSDRNTKYKVYDNPDGKHTTNDEYRLVNAKMAVKDAIARTDNTATYTGLVQEILTEKPIDRAIVTVTSADNSKVYPATTNAEGKFTLTLPIGVYTMEVSCNRYRTTIINDVFNGVSQGSPLDLVIYMEKLPEDEIGTITGNVSEQGSNARLAGVLVEITRVGSNTVIGSYTTGADGGYSFHFDKNVAYNLRFRKDGYVEQVQTNVKIGDSFYILVNATMVSLPFAGGTGTETDPYLVFTPQQLSNVRDNLTAHYKLMGDIDLASWGNWEPIGNLVVFFILLRVFLMGMGML